jgi:hypothetical protein
MSKKRYVLLSRILEQISDMEYESQLLHEEMNPGVSDVLEHWETVIPFEIPVELDEEALDRIRALLVYLLMNGSSLEQEAIYALVYGKGKKIIWN